MYRNHVAFLIGLFILVFVAACEPETKYTPCSPEQKRTEYCAEIFDPVCGSDGKTYGNSCFACQGGSSGWTTGKCAN